MPASNLYDLFKFDGIDAAFRNVIKALVPVGVSLFITRENEERETPDIGIVVNNISQTDTKKVWVAQGLSYTHIVLPSQFSGNIEFNISTFRDKFEINHSLLCGICRYAIYDYGRLINYSSESLEYYFIDQISNDTTQQSIDSVNKLDITTIAAQIIFSIRDTAWPTSI